MIKKYAVLIGVAIALIFMSIAIAVYPGGSMFNKNSVGFDWSKNFMSNLFATKALNGAENPSRIWASIAMIILPSAYAIFFSNMAKKIPDRNAGAIIKYGGVLNILVMVLIITPLHDLMLNISIALFWTCIVIITVFVFKTKLHFFKFFCLICLAIFYYSIFLWATNNWALLPTMQKLNFINSTLLIVGLEYFTSAKDFAHIKAKGRKELVTKG